MMDVPFWPIIGLQSADTHLQFDSLCLKNRAGSGQFSRKTHIKSSCYNVPQRRKPNG